MTDRQRDVYGYGMVGVCAALLAVLLLGGMYLDGRIV